MDTKIIDVLVGRNSDTEAVLRAMTALDDYGGEYEACPQLTENILKDEKTGFSPRAVYRFRGKYRYRIYIWCMQDLTGLEENRICSGKKEEQIFRQFLETGERESHVVVCVDMDESAVRGERGSEENADGSVFMGKIFL